MSIDNQQKTFWTAESLDDLWDLLQARLSQRIDDAREELVQALIAKDLNAVIEKHRGPGYAVPITTGGAWGKLSNEWLRAYGRKPTIHYKRLFFPNTPDPEESPT